VATGPVSESRAYLSRQFDTAWKLAEYHLKGLTTEECLWRPAARGPHVRVADDGGWIADWPEEEGYDTGPPSIAWITWHMIFWWSTVLDPSLKREHVSWPGSAEAVLARLKELHGAWQGLLASLSDSDLQSTARTKWPYRDRPFGDVVAWVNVELTKNAAELGYVRFLYADRGRSPN
jgi:hypothetical protein